MFAEAHYQDAEAARTFLESVRWPNGPVCPHCGCFGHIGKVNSKATSGRKTVRVGVYTCNDCGRQFTVTVGTVFERSHIALHIWLQASYLICCSKKGMSSHQLHRMLGVSYKTAWYMSHRLRAAMSEGDGILPRLGGRDEIVEVDETYFGTDPHAIAESGIHSKNKIVSLVERDGNVRSFHVRRVNAATLKTVVRENVSRGTRIMTDEAKVYSWIGAAKDFGGHYTTNHSEGEYSRGMVHSNTVEGFFSIVKRGLLGTYHHVGSQHLWRYLDEFDFRYSRRDLTDTERMVALLEGIDGKVLHYC
jgi:transposase-like protein